MFRLRGGSSKDVENGNRTQRRCTGEDLAVLTQNLYNSRLPAREGNFARKVNALRRLDKSTYSIVQTHIDFVDQRTFLQTGEGKYSNHENEQEKARRRNRDPRLQRKTLATAHLRRECVRTCGSRFPELSR